MQVKMKYKKSTKRTYVYEAVVDVANMEVHNAPIPTLYIKQIALPTRPEEITVTVSYAT